MKPYKLTPVEDKETWNSALLEFKQYDILQTWEWGEIKSLHGWQTSRFLVQEKGETIAAFQLLTKRVHPRLPIIVAYTPRGPLFDSKQVELNRLLHTIEETANNRGCTYVKVDADIDETTEQGEKWISALKNNGWQFSDQQVQAKNSGLTELFPDDPEGETKILKGMKQRGRRGIKNSAKRGITIRQGDTKDIVEFYRLFKITGARQGLDFHSLEYYREVYRMFTDGSKTDAALLLSEHPEETGPLASAMFIKFHEKVWYLYGASDDKRRSAMPQYPMQWEALKWSQSNGAKVFDWGGAATNPEDPNDMFANVWNFKKGLGANFHSGAGAWDKPLEMPKWRLFQLLNKSRRIFKR